MNDNKYDSNISPHSVQFHLNCAVIDNAVSEENTYCETALLLHFATPPKANLR